MKQESGFTLPELLGVITLLAVIALLAIPTVTKNIARGKQQLYQTQLENFKRAAQDWMAIHTLELPEGDIETSITIGCLKREGLLDSSIENPLTGKQFPNDMIVKIHSASNQYIYIVDEKSGSEDAVAIPSEKCSFNSEAITN